MACLPCSRAGDQRAGLAMDNRCPNCGKDLGSRKRVNAIVARMEIDCLHCKSRIQLNVHPLELKVVFFSFGSFIALGALAYALQSNALAVLALAIGVAGTVALPVLERTRLREWPRYIPVGRGSGGKPS